MASHVVIELDTSPPVLSWGQVERDPGELAVFYALNEPEVVAAEFVDAGGTAHGMLVEPDRLVYPADQTVFLAGTVRARVRDSVDNEAEYLLSLLVAWPQVGGGVMSRPAAGRVSGLLGGAIAEPLPGRVAEPEEGDLP